MKKSLRVMGVSVLTALLAVFLTSCKGGGKEDNGNGGNSEGDTGNVSGSVVEKGPVTEWEVLTSEVMKHYSSGDFTKGVEVAKRALQLAQQDYGPNHPNVALSLSPHFSRIKTKRFLSWIKLLS